MEERKKCFVIVPDKPMKGSLAVNYAIEPELSSFKDNGKDPIYEYLLADEIPDPGVVNSQLIDHILYDFLVIADITGVDPLILYLVGVRHARAKQLILIQSASDESDLKSLGGLRIIKYGDFADAENTKQLRKAILKQLEAIESNPKRVENPVSQAVEVELLSQQQEEFLNMLQEQQASMAKQVSQLSLLSKHIEDYTRKPLTGITQILWEGFKLIKQAKKGGKLWYVGMTLGLGPPHVYRHTEKGDINEQVRSYAPPDQIEAIEKRKPSDVTIFEQMIEDFTIQMSKVMAEAREARVVCLRQTEEILKDKFINPLAKRHSYIGLSDNIDEVVQNIITRHNKVAALVSKESPVKYQDSIPIQFIIIEKEERRACLVFHVGTENISAARLEDGELGFITEIDSVIDMFIGTAESLYETANINIENTE